MSPGDMNLRDLVTRKPSALCLPTRPSLRQEVALGEVGRVPGLWPASLTKGKQVTL